MELIPRPRRTVSVHSRFALSILTSLVLVLGGCTADDSEDGAAGESASTMIAAFDPMGPAPASPELFAPGWLSSPIEDRDATLSPDGSMFLFTRMGPRPAILLMQADASARGGWVGPSMASFSGLHPDIEPIFNPAGDQLWFASQRPGPDGQPQGYDLWWVPVVDGAFGEAQRPGEPVNTSGEEFFPSLTRDGALYFTTTREGGVGGEDIWVSRPVDTEDGASDDAGNSGAGATGSAWSEPECLQGGVNTPGFEFNAFVAPDESYLLFSRWVPEGDFGGGDLYVSFRKEDGTWGEAKNLGEGINTASLDYCPSVSPDGKTLFFSRRKGRAMVEHPTGEPLDYEAYMRWALGPGSGVGNIYRVDAIVIDRLRGESEED